MDCKPATFIFDFQMKYQVFEENTMSYRKKFSSAVRANPDVLSTNKGYNRREPFL